MSRPRALDLFSGAGGISTGLQRAGFDVMGVDIEKQPHYRGGEFVQGDALRLLRDRAFLREFDFIHASPPCQSHSTLRHLNPGKTYPDHIAETRFLLRRSGVPWSIENVPGAPLSRGRDSFLIQLCGTMFGLTTPDGRAELRRHRLFETSFFIFPHPECRHGGRESLSVSGSGLDSNARRWSIRRSISVHGSHGLPGESIRRREAREKRERKVITVTGHTPVENVGRRAISVTGGCAESKKPGWTGYEGGKGMALRETFSVQEARHAMGIDWPLPMKYLSQAVPPPYGFFIGTHALAFLTSLRR